MVRYRGIYLSQNARLVSVTLATATSPTTYRNKNNYIINNVKSEIF